MKIKDIDLFEEDLINMMEEFWALDNNDECAKETIKFLNKYKIDEDNNYGLKRKMEFTINQNKENKDDN
jgi:hypothetical protein